MAAIYTDAGSLKKLSAGAGRLADTLRPNYGPNGRNTIYDQTYDIPLVVNTGRKILPEIQLTDRLEQTGAALVREAALKVDRLNGDGTTVTVMMAGTLIREGSKMIDAGADPVGLRRGIMHAIPAVEQAVRRGSVAADSREMIEQTASVAADSPEIGKLVADAFEAVGPGGIITVSDSQEPATRLEVSGGVKYDYGFLSASFINVPAKQAAALEHPYLLLVNRRLAHLAELENILAEMIKKKASLFIVASDMDQELMNLLLTNIHREIFLAAVGKAPGYGDTRNRNMRALAAKTGAVLVEEDYGLELDRCGLEICGRADFVMADREKTLIRGLHRENRSVVHEMKVHTEMLLAEEIDPYEKEKLKGTLAILAGNMASLIAGGMTEYEMFEAKHQIENGVNAAYTAIRTGVTAGGGKGYLLAVPAVEQMIHDSHGEEERLALQCVRKALLDPARSIADNVGDNGDYVTERLMERGQDVFWGYDAGKHQFRDLRETGVLDPVGTVCSSFRAAAEIASVVLTAGAVVTE